MLLYTEHWTLESHVYIDCWLVITEIGDSQGYTLTE
jgi:hypothetical protein